MRLLRFSSLSLIFGLLKSSSKSLSTFCLVFCLFNAFHPLFRSFFLRSIHFSLRFYPFLYTFHPCSLIPSFRSSFLPYPHPYLLYPLTQLFPSPTLSFFILSYDLFVPGALSLLNYTMRRALSHLSPKLIYFLLQWSRNLV